MKHVNNDRKFVRGLLGMVLCTFLFCLAAQAKTEEPYALPSTTPQFGKTDVKFILLNYQKSERNRVRFSLFNGLFSERETNIKPQPSANGTYSFSITKDLILPVTAKLVINRREVPMLVVPNGSLTVIVDSAKVSFEGTYAAFNTDLQQVFDLTDVTGNTMFEDIYGMTPLQYKEYIAKNYQEKKKKLSKASVNKNCKTYVNALLDMEYASRMSSCHTYLSMSNSLKNDTVSKNDTIPIDSASFFKEIKKLSILRSPYQRFYPYLCDFTNGWLYQYMAKDEFLENLNKASRFAKPLKTRNPFSSTPTSALGEEQLRQIKEEITNEAVKALLLSKNQKVVQQLAADAESSRKLREESVAKGQVKIVDVDASLSAEQVMDTLLAPYRGKVVLVDFWNTWCMPCRMAMKQIKPIKDAMKDVVYVYIANESSPVAQWNEMVPNIHGVHARISSKQSAMLNKKYDFSAIPTYLVFNKQGEKVYQTTGFPGVETLQEELNKASK